MIGRLVFTGVVVVATAINCGGQVDVVSSQEKGGTGGNGFGARGGSGGTTAGRGGRGGTGGTGGVIGTGGSIAPDSGPDTFEDPPCPDEPPPAPQRECDPFATRSGCRRGEGCYPYVDHPGGTGCGAQTYGTVCLPAGAGVQGDSCEGGTLDCAPGFVCVVGAKPGKHCVQLCPLDETDGCPPGMVCGVLDVEGYGVCS